MAEDFSSEDLQQQGLISRAVFPVSQDCTADKLFADMQPEAEKRIKSRLVLEAIVKAENIEVSDEEYEAELNKMAESYEMEVDKIKEFMGEYEQKQIRGRYRCSEGC